MQSSSSAPPTLPGFIFLRAGFFGPTYHSVKQLSSDAVAPLRLLTLSSASKLIPKPLLSPDAPVSAVVQKKKVSGAT